MHVGGHWLNAIYSNVVGQQAVELLCQHIGVELGASVEMGGHAAGMDSGVCAPCSGDADFLAQQQREASLQFALHRDSIGLYLPPVIAGAIVTEPDKISLHTLVCFGAQRYDIFLNQPNKSYHQRALAQFSDYI